MESRTFLTFSAVAPRLGLPVNTDALNSVTRGLVGDTSFAILPEVTKEHTFLLTFLFQLVRISTSVL
jgi:alpha-1,3-glucosyltransferase